jgi:hypothetical protein
MKKNQVIDDDGKIKTTYPIRKIPYVPSAVRHMKLVIHPVKK